MRVLGLASMGVAAGFILRQGDYKRMLAYSSVEHMGILALGIGVGGIAQAGAMLHAVNHSVTKGMMFLLAGNLLAAYGTKNISEVGGMMRRLPVSGLLWLAGLLAITGSPPFGTFNSELMILRGALEGGRWGVAIGYLAALGIIFAAMSKIMLTMVYGQSGGSDPSGGGTTLPAATGRAVEPIWSIVPPIVLAAGSMLLGVYIPPRLMSLIQQAAQSVGVQ
jgi:hydrogenase-4 component F